MQTEVRAHAQVPRTEQSNNYITLVGTKVDETLLLMRGDKEAQQRTKVSAQGMGRVLWKCPSDELTLSQLAGRE